MKTMLYRFRRNARGSALIETALIFPLLILMTLGFVDLARAFAEWNSAEKATQVGVRAAIITDPVAQELATFDCDNSSIVLGTKCSAGGDSFGTIICNGATSQCDNQYTFDSTAFNTILSRMKIVFPQLQASDVIVEYSDIGLGFAGRKKPVPAVTVKLTNITFNFLVLNSFLGLGSISLPDFHSTLVGEDLTAAGA